jgi:hypothetical protein
MCLAACVTLCITGTSLFTGHILPTAAAQDAPKYYPAPQDTPWQHAKRVKTDTTRYSKYAGGAFLDIAGYGTLTPKGYSYRSFLVGQDRTGQGFITTFYFDKKNFRDTQSVAAKPETAFVVKHFMPGGRQHALAGFTPKSTQKATKLYLYNRKRDKPTLLPGGDDKRIISAARDRDIAALLTTHIPSQQQYVLGMDLDGNFTQQHLPNDTTSYTHISIDSWKADNTRLSKVFVAGYAYAGLFAPSQGAGFQLMIKSDPPRIADKGSGKTFPAKDILPKRVFFPFAPSDTNTDRGLKVTASALNRDQKIIAFGGTIEGMQNQRLADNKTFRTDGFLKLFTPNTPPDGVTQMFVRTDKNKADGLTIRDIHIADSKIAVLLREKQGAPYSAVVFLDKTGNVRGKTHYNNLFLNALSDASYNFIGAGYIVRKDGTQYPAATMFSF